MESFKAGDVELVAVGGVVKLFVDEVADLTQETIDQLKRALDQAGLVAAEQRALFAEYPAGVPCGAPMVHDDQSISPCTRPKTHLLSDSDHMDEHGHRAPVLVHQSTIREVRALQAARDAGLIND